MLQVVCRIVGVLRRPETVVMERHAWVVVQDVESKPAMHFKVRTRKSYTLPFRNKFALPEITVSKFDKIFIFPILFNSFQ